MEVLVLGIIAWLLYASVDNATARKRVLDWTILLLVTLASIIIMMDHIPWEKLI
jgi:hypothetical protein